MGQYYVVMNMDKREYLKPHKMNDGAKLMELDTTLQGLAVLLATSNGRGGGDCRTTSTEVPGRWAGDRIAVIGDYSDPPWVYPGMDTEEEEEEPRDISGMVLAVLREDGAVS